MAENSYRGVFLAEPYPTLITGAALHYVVLETKHALRAEDATGLRLQEVGLTGSLIKDLEQNGSILAVRGPSSITPS